MRELPFDLNKIEKIKKDYPTPFYLYDEKMIRETIRMVKDAFSWNEGYKEYYAVKALPTPAILKILNEEGTGLDCASRAEIILATKCGVSGHNIMFTSNETLDEDYQEAIEAGAIINLDSYDQIDNYLRVIKENNFKLPETICLRYNPGSFEIDASFIGELQESKFGMTKSQIKDSIKKLKDLGIKHFGIHAMLAGNSLKEKYYALEGKEIFKLAIEIKNELGIKIEFVDFGGGIGIPYKDDETPIDIYKVGNYVKEVYEEILANEDLKIKIFTEMGRFITGPHGYLVTSVVGLKNTYKNYIGVDATMADLMRPGMYGKYHGIQILQKEKGEEKIFDVVGSICENNDKFAIDRLLPSPKLGDTLVILDAGAHSHSMGFNYNGRLRCKELLLQENGDIKLIRRKQTVEDYFSTLVF